MTTLRTAAAASFLMIAAAATVSGCKEQKSAGVSPQQMADAIHAILAADRAVYSVKVVNRLQDEEKIIKATEHWKDDKTLPLPAQMFRMGSELVAEPTIGLHYQLVSEWPINKQNATRTETEKTGFKFIIDNPGKNFYGEEDLGGVKYFTAVYPDKAVALACATCHNAHPSSPRQDYKLGDIMGAVVVRFPLDVKPAG